MLEFIIRILCQVEAGVIKKCIPKKVKLSINLKDADRDKRVGQSVLDSGKSICKVPEVARSLVFKE